MRHLHLVPDPDSEPSDFPPGWDEFQAARQRFFARLISQDKGLSDLVQVEVPKRIVLNAPVVNADNVDEYRDLCFES